MFTFTRNSRSPSIGISVHLPPESLFTFAQNTHNSIVGGFSSAYSQYWNVHGNVTLGTSSGTTKVTGLTPAGYIAFAPGAARSKGIALPNKVSKTVNGKVTRKALTLNGIFSYLVQQRGAQAARQLVLSYVQSQLGPSLVTRYQNAQAKLDQLSKNYALNGSAFTSKLNEFLSNENSSGFQSYISGQLKGLVENGVAWTKSQLVNTVAQNKVTGTVTALKTQLPNIKTPGAISLIGASGSTNSRLGGFAPNTVIQLPGLATGTVKLTGAQRAELEAASPGDITYSPATTGSAATLTISHFHPFYEQGSKQVNAAVTDGVYLSTSSGDLNLGSIASNGGQIRLFATNGISQVSPGSYISGGPLGSVIHAAGGSIGTSARSLMLKLTGRLNSVKATGAVYIDQATGSLDLGNFASGGAGGITVANGSLVSILDPSVVHVQASELALHVPNGSVGAGSAPLTLTLSSGPVSGQVGKAVYLQSPKQDLGVNGLAAGGFVDINAVNGNLTLASLSSGVQSGPAITLNAGAGIFGDSSSGADVSAPGTGAQLLLNAESGIGTASRSLIVDAPILKQASTVSGGIYLTDLESLSVPGPLVVANGSLGLTVQGNLSFSSLNSGSNISVDAKGSATSPGNLSGTSITAINGNIDTKAKGNLTVQRLNAGKKLRASTQKGDISINEASSLDSTTLTASAGSMTVTTLTAPEATLSALKSIDTHRAFIERLIQFHSSRLQAHVKQTRGSAKPLRVAVTGWQGGLASEATLSFDAPNGVVFSPLDVGTGQVKFAQSDYVIKSGYVGSLLSLITPKSSVLMNNKNTSLRRVDVQLYQPNESFFLAQKGTNTYTNAFTLHYRNGFKVQVPNYLGVHQDTPVIYTGGSGYLASSQSAVHGSRITRRLIEILYRQYMNNQSGITHVQTVSQAGGVNVSFQKKKK